MKLNKQTLIGVLLIAIGAIFLLNTIGLHVGPVWGLRSVNYYTHSLLSTLFSYLIPIAMIIFGWSRVRKGGGIFSWIILILGLFILTGKLLAGLFPIILALLLIYFGYRQLKQHS